MKRVKVTELLEFLKHQDLNCLDKNLEPDHDLLDEVSHTTRNHIINHVTNQGRVNYDRAHKAKI